MARRKRDGLYLRGRFWYTRDPRDGRIVTTECEDLVAAKLKRSGWEREAADPHHAASARETLGDAYERVIEHLSGLGRKVEYHEHKLGHWVRIFGAGAKLSHVGTPDSFDAYVKQRRAEPVSEMRNVTDHTISKEVGIMLFTLKLAKRVGRYTGDLSVLRPMDLRVGYVPRTRALTLPELAALLAALPAKRAAFVALVVCLGLRRSEAFKLMPADFDLEAWTVQVRGTKTAGARRVVPILPPFRRLVQAALKHVPLAAWSKGSDVRDLAVACKHAGIARCTANDLRRTFVTLLANAKVDRDDTRRMVGHSPKSKLLEFVYDQPSAQELAERAGELATFTRQVGETIDENLSGRAGLRSRDIWRVKPVQAEPYEESPDSEAANPAGDGRGEAASVTDTRHSPAAHALAFAAARVLRGRTFVLQGSYLRAGKAARRA